MPGSYFNSVQRRRRWYVQFENAVFLSYDMTQVINDRFRLLRKNRVQPIQYSLPGNLPMMPDIGFYPTESYFSSILRVYGFTYLQSMDFQREPQSKHHLYCGQEKRAHCHGSLLLRLGTHQIQNRTRDAHKISPHGTMTKRTPAMNWDHAVSWGGGLG